MKYSHILSPLKIGNVTLKSRLLSSMCLLASQDNFEASLAFYENFAKKGAAVVTFSVGTWPNCEGKRSKMSNLHMDDPKTAEAFRHMVDRIHTYGTLCSVQLRTVEPMDVAISDTPNWDEIPMTGDYSMAFSNKPGISLERLEGMIDDYVFQCTELKKLGFDMVTIYMSYRGSILANSLSPLLNQRTDKYGGATMKERATLTLELFRRIKESCGQDFLIEAQISAIEEGGYTLGEFLEYAKLCEGLVDIFQIRGHEGSTTHVNGYNMKKGQPLNLQYAEAFKNHNIRAVVAPIGGFTDVDDIERFIAEGKTDAVQMARGFIRDEAFWEKLQEGRGEEITPCLLCNGCHNHTCAVNPETGYWHLPPNTQVPIRKKRVAVVGGGPAGMRAAVIAANRGHNVTLFEKQSVLGGQLQFAEYPEFKWPLNDYRKWLIHEVEKANVDVRLNQEATPTAISGYDAIIVASGSAPARIPVVGADGSHIWTVEDAIKNQEKLGHSVVVIGGASSGRETALYLAESGHEVTMLTRGEARLYDDAHAKRACEIRFETQPNFKVIEFAETKEIGVNYVVCDVKQGVVKAPSMFDEPKFQSDPNAGEHEPSPDIGVKERPKIYNASTKDGRQPIIPDKELRAAPPPNPFVSQPDFSQATTMEIRLECDSIVVSGGRTSVDVSPFLPLAEEVYIIGDAIAPGDVRNCTETAYAASMAL